MNQRSGRSEGIDSNTFGPARVRIEIYSDFIANMYASIFQVKM